MAVPLQDVFGTPRLLVRQHHGSEASRRTPEGGERLTACTLETALSLAEAAHRYLLVLGPAGSGKTTLLAHLFGRVVREGSERLGLPAGLVPVMLPCRDILAEDVTSGTLQALVRRRAERMAHTEGAEELIQSGRPILLLADGLDEVRDAAARERVLHWLTLQVGAWPGGRLVVASRPSAFLRWAEGSRSRWLEAHVQPLGEEAIRAFVHRFYEAVIEGTGSPMNPEAMAGSLLETIFSKEYAARSVLGELASNPLMLWIMCVMHWSRGCLPDSRSALYEGLLDLLLRARPAHRAQAPVLLRGAEDVLGALAFRMFERGALEIDARSAREVVGRALELVPSVDLTADELLRRAADDAGVLVPAGPDGYRFLHRGIQAYLAARHVAAHAPGVLADHAGDPMWRDVVSLAAEIGHVDAGLAESAAAASLH